MGDGERSADLSEADASVDFLESDPVLDSEDLMDLSEFFAGADSPVFFFDLESVE